MVKANSVRHDDSTSVQVRFRRKLHHNLRVCPDTDEAQFIRTHKLHWQYDRKTDMVVHTLTEKVPGLMHVGYTEYGVEKNWELARKKNMDYSEHNTN